MGDGQGDGEEGVECDTDFAAVRAHDGALELSSECVHHDALVPLEIILPLEFRLRGVGQLHIL